MKEVAAIILTAGVIYSSIGIIAVIFAKLKIRKEQKKKNREE